MVEPLEARVLLAAAVGPREMEYLDRGVVVTRVSSTQAFVSWRSLALDPAGMAFNVYRSTNGGAPVKVNSSPLTGGTNYTDTPGSAALGQDVTYTIRPVVGGIEQAAGAGAYMLPGASASGPLIQIPLRDIGDYSIRHMSVADLDGDGKYDYIVDRYPPAPNEVATRSELIEAYKSDGTFLWAIDAGPNSFDRDNIEGGASTIDMGNWDGVTAYDMDGDGLAEVLYRSARGVVFGDGSVLSAPDDDVQFISVIDGRTGAEKARVQVPTDFIADGPMGASLGIGYLDGVHPSLVAKMKNRVGSTYFNQMFVAYDYDGTAITQRWKYVTAPVDSDNGHNIRIVDVDGDGKDEVADTAQVIDDDGTLLYNMRYGTPSVGHGDRFHIGDLDPDRPGLEGYAVQQNNPGFVTEFYWDAATGEILHAHYDDHLVDVGRGETGDIDPSHRGYEYWSFYGIYNSSTPVAGAAPVETKVADEPNRPWPNFRIWWDGDVGSEDLNSNVINKWNPTTQGNDRLTTLYHYGSPTDTSGEAPIFYGDIFGDWREEVIFENSDHLALDIYTTQYASSTRIYTLAEDPEYRNAMTVKGYYQSNMVDYYLGYGMDAPPTPNIRVLPPANGGANAGPTVAAPAGASSTAVAGTAVDLSVLGADDGGEANLTYTWWATGGGGAVTFSANATNAAKNVTATFSAAGTYNLIATIRDAGGRTITSGVTVVVNQTLAGVGVTPSAAAVLVGGTQQFSATAIDQFGDPMASSLTFGWLVVSGGGTISGTGLYTAPQVPGSVTVRAQAGSLYGDATVTVSRVTDAYQAEGGTYGGGVTIDTNASGYDGTGFANFPGSGGYVQWNGVDGGAGGPTVIAVRYALAASARAGRLTVNGVTQSVTFPSTGSWNAWSTLQVAVTLNAGAVNTIRLESTGQDLGNVDELQVQRGTGFNAAPTAATPPAGSPNPVTGTTANLSVLGADDGGEANLTYTWAATGPAAVTFSANGSNAAKNTVATFGAAGTYTFAVTIRDAAGLGTASSVTVTVEQTPAGVAISPASVTVTANDVQQFVATVTDQFGAPLATQPAFTWSVPSGGGSVTAAGLYTAPGTTGAAAVRAAAGPLVATAAVTVVAGASPRGWWKMDETGGAVVSDASGNGYNGTAANGPAWVGGVSGNALSFDGVNDYVNLPNSIVSSAAGSVSMWIRTGADFTDAAHLFYMSPVTTGNGGGSENELHVNFLSDERLQFYIRGSTADVNITTASGYADNVWHHVVATWDVSGNAVLYVDGAPVGSAVDDSNSFTGSAVTRLGRPAASVRYYNGLMDDVRLYNVAISPSQVQALYVGSGTVTGTAYVDDDGDGTRGASEPALAGAAVYLDVNDNGQVDPGEPAATTDASGRYTFASIPSGTYAVRESAAPAGYFAPSAPAVSVVRDATATADLAHVRVAYAGTAGDDAYTLRRDAAGRYEVLANGTLVASLPSDVPSLSFVLGGGNDTLTLDLSDGSPIPPGGVSADAESILVPYDGGATPVATIRQALADGTLIDPSAATALRRLGYFDTGSVVQVKPTVTGDANLNGKIDADDYALLDRGRLRQGTFWWQGDFDYDGDVDGADAALLYQAAVGGTGAPEAPAVPVSSPAAEPPSSTSVEPIAVPDVIAPADSGAAGVPALPAVLPSAPVQTPRQTLGAKGKAPAKGGHAAKPAAVHAATKAKAKVKKHAAVRKTGVAAGAKVSRFSGRLIHWLVGRGMWRWPF